MSLFPGGSWVLPKTEDEDTNDQILSSDLETELDDDWKEIIAENDSEDDWGEGIDEDGWQGLLRKCSQKQHTSVRVVHRLFSG